MSELEERIYAKLESLHGQSIDKEMGGMVAVNQARMLLDILEISWGYGELCGVRERTVEGSPDLDLGTTECVDVSSFIDGLESFDEEQ